MRSPQKTVAGVTLAALLALLAGPAVAQQVRSEGLPPTDPVLAYAAQVMPRNQFAINSAQDTELIRYTTPRDIEICVPKLEKGVDTQKPVSVKVTWDGNKGVVRPGNCLSFDAKQVSVRMDGQLPQNENLIGTFRVIHNR